MGRRRWVEIEEKRGLGGAEGNVLQTLILVAW